MNLGISVRLMGASATRETIRSCALAAEAAGLDEIWVPDHIAIPPDDAEGSEGRYFDPLASLAWLAGQTERIGLGTGVLILPYRPALPTAKWLATIQALSGNRLRLGVGIGWMQAEFDALGIPRSRRGRLADETLDLLDRCFSAEDDIVRENDQDFLFRPHPPKPPIYVGGHGDHALRRAVRFGDGWMPMTGDPAKLAPSIDRMQAWAEEAGRGPLEVVCFGAVDTQQPTRGADQLAALAEVGVTRFATGGRYDDVSQFQQILDGIVAVREAG